MNLIKFHIVVMRTCFNRAAVIIVYGWFGMKRFLARDLYEIAIKKEQKKARPFKCFYIFFMTTKNLN